MLPEQEAHQLKYQPILAKTRETAGVQSPPLLVLVPLMYLKVLPTIIKSADPDFIRLRNHQNMKVFES